jgi:hypothetical protein
MANLGSETGGYAVPTQLSDLNPLGTIHGQSTTDLIGFYGLNPGLAQQSSSVDLITQLVNLGLIASGTAIQGGGAAPVLLSNSTSPGTALTAGANAGRTNILGNAAGAIATLPAATGTGNKYDFVVGVTVTSNSTQVLVASTADKMWGTQFMVSGASTACFTTATADTGVTFNGSTTGGFIGDKISFTDVSTHVWQVTVNGHVTGTAATCFS